MAFGAAGGASGPAPDLRTPGMSFFALPPHRCAAGMRHIIRREWKVFLGVPFPENMQAVIFLAIA